MNFDFLLDTFLRYTGTRLHILLFFATFLYIPFGKNKEIRQVLFYPLVLILLLTVANPLMVWLWDIIGMDTQVYWRNYWLLLTTEVIACVAVLLIYKATSRLMRCITACAVFLAIILCGSFMFTPQNFAPSQNLYKLHNETLAVGDALLSEDLEEGRVCVPIEMTSEIRQYSAAFNLTFGREVASGYSQQIGDERYKQYSKRLYNILYALTTPFYDDVALRETLEATSTSYIVQRKDSPTIPDMNASQILQLIAETPEHNIYYYQLSTIV